MMKALADPPFGDIGTTLINGSNLPRHSDHHRCYLRGSAIRVRKASFSLSLHNLNL